MTAPTTVHVWSLRLDVPQDAYVPLLALDEKQRAERLRFDVHRSRFVVARGALRIILGRWLGLAPAQVRFTYGRFGKPALAGAGSPHFNVSHSDDRALIAVSRDVPVGIDLEAHRAIDRFDSLAASVFNEREREQLASWSGEEQRQAFFRGWARKEAFFKCTGEGLSTPIQSVTVDLADAALLAIDTVYAGPWSIRDVPVPSGFSAAVVAQALDLHVELREDISDQPPNR